MRFDIITVFPKILDSYFEEALIKRARRDKKIEIFVHDLRDWTKDKHRTTDDTPYGGGAGMLMKIEPIDACLDAIISKSPYSRKKIRVILLGAKGHIFETKKALKLANSFKQLIFICGRYEGVDERVNKYLVDEEISIGRYVLSGGELASAVILDVVSRFIPGVLGNPDSLKEESHNNNDLEYPQYTKPPVFKGWKVPKVLISGNHEKIASWRRGKMKSTKRQNKL